MPHLTDEQMDARLRAAGARWREVTPVPSPTERGHDLDVTPEPPRPHRARTWIAALSGAALVAAAVVIGVAVTRGDHGSPRPAAQTELAGTSWRLTELRRGGTDALSRSANPSAIAGTPPALLTFAAAGTRIVVDDGCNTGSGPVTIRAAQLAVGNLARTAMACPATQTSSDVIDQVFVGDVNWTIAAGRLFVTKPGVGALVYAPLPVIRPSTDPAELEGVTWGLTGVEHDNPTSASGSGFTDGSGITLTVDARGDVRVTTMCGTATVPATVGSGTVVFGRPARVACGRLPSDAAAEVTALNHVLQGRATWAVTDNTLTITKTVGSDVTTLTLVDQASGDRSGTDALRGTSWLLAQVTDPTFHQSLDTATTKLRLTIDNVGSLSVDDGVNLHSVPDGRPVVIRPGTITVTDLSSTLAGCAPRGTGPNPCTRAQVVSDVFTGTIGWAVDGARLTLTKGATTLVYVRAR